MGMEDKLEDSEYNPFEGAADKDAVAPNSDMLFLGKEDAEHIAQYVEQINYFVDTIGMASLKQDFNAMAPILSDFFLFAYMLGKEKNEA